MNRRGGVKVRKMDKKKVFGAYYSRLNGEAIVNSLLCSLILGFSLNAIMAAVAWFVGFQGFWIAIALLVVGVGASFPLFYFFKFKPTIRRVAKRLDSMGLEERLITMTELENDESFMAQRQRVDAFSALAKLPVKLVKMRVPLAVLILASVITPVGVTFTTVTALYESGAIGKGGDVIKDITGQEDFVTVSYFVAENQGGMIEGESDQILLVGDSASTVIAVPEDGWMFAEWDDGYADPVRTDINVQTSVEYYAIFMPVGGEGEGEGEGEEGGDKPGDQPGEGQGDDPSDKPGEGAGGKYEEGNQIIDGETYYRDVLTGEYYEKAMEVLTSGGDLPPEIRAIIEAYFEIIA